MRSELSEQSSRTGNLRRQMEGQRAHITEIDAQTVQLHGELDAMLEQARTLSGQADGRCRSGRRGRLASQGSAVYGPGCGETGGTLGSAQRYGRRGRETRRAAALGERSEARAHREETARRAEESRRALAQAREACESAANVVSGHTLRMEGRRQKTKAAADQVAAADYGTQCQWSLASGCCVRWKRNTRDFPRRCAR